MKTFRDNLSLVADVLGILAFVGLSATGVVAWIESRGAFSWLLIGGVFVLGVLLPAALYLVLKKMAPKFTEHLFKKGWQESKELTLNAYDLKDRLPTNGVLRQQFSQLVNHAKKWDKDAQIKQIGLKLDVMEAGTIMTLGIELTSTWKKRQAEFSVLSDGRRQTKVREYFPRSETLQDAAEVATVFFRSPEDWRKEVVLLYGPIEHRVKRHLYITLQQTGRSKPRISVQDDSKTVAASS